MEIFAENLNRIIAPAQSLATDAVVFLALFNYVEVKVKDFPHYTWISTTLILREFTLAIFNCRLFVADCLQVYCRFFLQVYSSQKSITRLFQ